MAAREPTKLVQHNKVSGSRLLGIIQPTGFAAHYPHAIEKDEKSGERVVQVARNPQGPPSMPSVPKRKSESLTYAFYNRIAPILTASEGTPVPSTSNA